MSKSVPADEAQSHLPDEPVPVTDKDRGPMYGTVKFLGDIVEPIDEVWDAMKDHCELLSKTVPADEAQSRLLDLLHERAEFVITKDGKPVARVIPIVRSQPMRTLEELRGSGRILGDILDPVDAEWDVER